jgi:GT2 family glycosyltransferase
MRICFIYLSFYSCREISASIKSFLPLIRLEEPKIFLDIIIVDNSGCPDHFTDLKATMNSTYSDLNIEYIYVGYNSGYSAGNNHGLKLALKNRSNDFICILNPDVKSYGPHDISRLIYISEIYSNCAMLGPCIVNPSGSKSGESPISQPRLIADLFTSDFKNLCQRLLGVNKTSHSDMNYVYAVCGCFYFAHRSVWEKLDFIPEITFMYFEEWFIADRLQFLKIPTVYVDCVSVQHMHDRGFKTFASAKARASMQFEAVRSMLVHYGRSRFFAASYLLLFQLRFWCRQLVSLTMRLILK